MVKIADVIQDEVGENIGIPGQPPEVPDADPQPAGGFSFDFGWIKTPTGDGKIEDYLDHPLNFNGSRGIAQVLRGVTGFAGNLQLAIIDIILGVLNFSKERRGLHGAVNTVRE